MRRVALLSLLHDRGKFLAALAGVAFAATLVLVQTGLYYGFLDTSSTIIRRVGGDIWVFPRGIPVVDNAETMSAGTRALVAGHRCVRSVRGLALSFSNVRNPLGVRDAGIVVGVDPDPARPVPWTFARGVPADLHAPFRIAVDEGDLEKLKLPADPIGSTLEINEQIVRIAALTRGVRSFTLSPYLFTELATARRLIGMGEGQASYWVVDLHSPDCTEDYIAHVRSNPQLEAMTTDAWAKFTEVYWVNGSGAGTALGFSALLGLLVGAVIVGQTLYAITREHLKELATLKAVGASSLQLAGFVAWQVLVLVGVGGLAGSAMAFAMADLVRAVGLTIVLSSEVLWISFAAIAGMCVVASFGSLRTVWVLDAAEVFR